MKERDILITLFDYYSELLSDTQKNYFIDYYFNNLSLGEIAENYDISRNAVHKQIKNAEDKLKLFEENLKIVKKNEKILKVIDKIEDKKIKEELINIIES